MEETKNNPLNDKMEIDNTEMAFEDNSASIIIRGKLGAEKGFEKGFEKA